MMRSGVCETASVNPHPAGGNEHEIAVPDQAEMGGEPQIRTGLRIKLRLGRRIFTEENPVVWICVYLGKSVANQFRFLY